MYYLNILYCNVLSEDSCPASVQFDSGWSGTENGDFRLSAPARPRAAPTASRPAPGTSIGRPRLPHRAIAARSAFSRPQRRKKVEK